MPRGYKITPNFDTLSKTINILGSELGNVIKDQAGAKYFKIVEDIRLNSKKYRQTNNNKYLDSIFKIYVIKRRMWRVNNNHIII